MSGLFSMRGCSGRRVQRCQAIEQLEARQLLAGDLVAHFVADAMKPDVSDGEVISQWTDRLNQTTAVAAGTPTLMHDRFSGRAAVRFDASDGADFFRIDKSASPLVDANGFSVVVAFASSGPTDGSGVPWFNGTGLVDANTQGFGQDWGLTLTAAGQASAGIGAGLGNEPTSVTTEQLGLLDEQLHTITMTRQDSTVAIYADGVLAAMTDQATTEPRGRLDITIGDLQTGGFPLTGDIAEVRMFDGAVSAAEITQLHAELSRLYDNARPVANPDEYEFNEDDVLSIVPAAEGVLQNDTDAEGDMLTATIIDEAEHGSVALSEDGSFVYSSPADFFGIDSFRYVASDTRDSNIATVTLNIANVYDPASGVEDVYRVLPTEVLQVSPADGVLQNDRNPDRGPLTAVLATDASFGQLQLGDDGSFSFNSQGQAGVAEFTYAVDDGSQQSAPTRVQIIVNTPPTTKDDLYSVNEDELLVVNPLDGVLSNDHDVDGDALAARIVQEPSHGELALAVDGSFVYAPFRDFFGEDQFQYQAADDDADSEPSTVTLQVVSINDPPMAAADVYFVSSSGLQVDASRGVLRNDTDTEADSLAARLETAPTNGTVQLDESGAFVYQPNGGFQGRDRFTYRAGDTQATSEATEVTLYVGQSPVVISEVLAANVTSLETALRPNVDENFSRDTMTPDWIELQNISNATIDAGGFFLSDEVNNPTRWQIPPDTLIAPNGYIVLFASSKDVRNPSLDELGIVHTNFSLNLQAESIVLAFPDGRIAETIELGQQYPDVSFATDDDARLYMDQPTPGAANASPLEGVVQPVGFSHQRGYYSQAFDLRLSTETPDSTIRYTTDGSLPTTDNGQPYGSPIAIETTSTIRAAAFRDGYRTSDARTHSFLFLADVIDQPDSPAGYPTSWAGMPADYGMDPDVVGPNNLFEDRYRDSVVQDLQSLPTLSLVFDRDDVFGTRGIYQNPLGTGDRWERSTSVEFFDPTGGETGFHVNSGIRVMGGSSRQPDIPKHSFRLEFREQYGHGKLNYPLYADAPFGENATESFDELVVRVGFNNSWMHRHYYQGFRGEQPRDQWVRDLQFAMGQHSARGRFIHVYLNGMYWGIYNLQERPAAPFFEEYFGGDKDTDWDVINSNEPIDGERRAWSEATRDARQASSLEGYQAYQQQVDVVNLADYMLMNFYVGNTDWDGHNWISAKKKPDGPFHFYAWDSEFAISLPPSNSAVGENAERQIINVNRTGQNNGSAPSGIHQNLARNEEYRMLFADRVQKHFFNDGVLTPEHATRLFLQRIEKIDRAVVAESARWGDFRRDVNPGRWRSDQFDLFTRDEHFLAQQDFIVNRYLPVRTGIVLEQLRRRNLYPDVAAPQLNRHGGLVPAGFALSIDAPQAAVYFTLDGNDPRQVGGDPSPAAQQYNGAITLTQSAVLKARVLQDDVWSALTEVEFRVGQPAAADSLRVSEVHYHPADLTNTEQVAGFTDADDFEFIELVNVSDQNIDLTAVAFTQQTVDGQTLGIQFDFADADIQELAAGSRLVIVEDLEAFRFRYGDQPSVAGQWSGGLSNQSEPIVMEIDGRLALAFSYSDQWYPATDGQGYSLVVADPSDDDLSQWGRAAGWQSSLLVGGSPGFAEARPGDVNRDGRFDSADLVRVFQVGEFEDGIAGNSTFEEGDWDGDRDFTTRDLVIAFQFGGYVVAAELFTMSDDTSRYSLAAALQGESHSGLQRDGLRRDSIDQAFADEPWNELLELKLPFQP